MSQPQVQPKKIGKFRASYLLATESLELLRKDKEVMWFPVIGIFAGLLILALFVVTLYFIYTTTGYDFSDESEEMPLFVYPLIFVVYILEAFIVAFTQGAITYIVHQRIQGGDATFSDGWNAAMSKFETLFVWALISATVGFVLRTIAERSKILMKIVVWFIGAAWSLLTFFIVPTLMLEDKSVTESIKESGTTFKNTWGETLISGFGLGLFFLGLHIMGIIVFIGIAVLIGWQRIPVDFLVLPFVGYLIFAVGLSILSSALTSVLRVVLYVYAKSGQVPDTFDPQLLMGMIKSKK